MIPTPREIAENYCFQWTLPNEAVDDLHDILTTIIADVRRETLEEAARIAENDDGVKPDGCCSHVLARAGYAIRALAERNK